MKILGKISDANLAAAYEIARSIQLTQEVHSSYAPNRTEKWFRYFISCIYVLVRQEINSGSKS